MVAGGESSKHRELKDLACGWAVEAGFAICAREVRIPRSNFRADVVACRKPLNGGDQPGETAVFECKQARADLLKDSRSEDRTRKRLAALRARQAELEALLSRHLPSLRHGDSLFPEYDTLELEGFRHETLHRVRREAETLSRGLYGGTKFDRMIRYRSADFCYLVLSEGIADTVAPPQGWGVLVPRGGSLELTRRPTRLEAGAAHRLALLVSMARKSGPG
jgi:hypothetical protein